MKKTDSFFLLYTLREWEQSHVLYGILQRLVRMGICTTNEASVRAKGRIFMLRRYTAKHFA